ncbi:MAG: hypothetical protein AMXMBFR8_12020 [Nevskiales bacterium]
MSEIRHLAIIALPSVYFLAIVTQYRWYFLCVAAVVIAGIAREWWTFVSWRSSRRLIIPQLLFLLALSMSAWWAFDPMVTLTGLGLPLVFTLLFWSVAGWAQEQPLLRQTTPLLVMVWAIGAVYAYVFLRFGTLKPIDEEVASTFGAGSNAGAMHLVAAAPLLLWRARVGQDSLSWLTVALAAALIIVSGTRAAFLVAPLVTAAALVMFNASRKFRLTAMLRAALIVAGASALAAATPAGQTTIGRLEISATILLDSGSLLDPREADYERALTYVEGLRAFQEHPYTGIGYQNMRVWLDDRYGVNSSSHNLVVTLLAEAGWPATVAFGALIFSFFSTLRRGCLIDPRRQAREYYVAVAIAMTGVLLLSMFHQLLDFQMFYFLLGIATAAPALIGVGSGHEPKQLRRLKTAIGPALRVG